MDFVEVMEGQVEFLFDEVVVEGLWELDKRVAVVEMEVSVQYLELRTKVSVVGKV